MNITIKNATIEDIDKGLLEVYIEGYRYHQNGRADVFANVTDEKLKEDYIKNFDRLSTIVILDDNKIVGYLSYIIKNHLTKKLDVDQLVVLKSYQKRGLGKLLMEEAKRIGKENNCDRIELNCWLFNDNAIKMYEHIGYKKQRTIYEMKL